MNVTLITFKIPIKPHWWQVTEGYRLVEEHTHNNDIKMSTDITMISLRSFNDFNNCTIVDILITPAKANQIFKIQLFERNNSGQLLKNTFINILYSVYSTMCHLQNEFQYFVRIYFFNCQICSKLQKEAWR